MFIEIGSYDAKTRLPELLRAVQAGQRYTITLRGKAVADLVPSGQSRGTDTLAAVGAMRDFPRVRHVDAQVIQDWITEGRR